MIRRKSSRIKEKVTVEESIIPSINRSKRLRVSNTLSNEISGTSSLSSSTTITTTSSTKGRKITQSILVESRNSPDTLMKEDVNFIFLQHFFFLLCDRYRIHERISSPEILYEVLTTQSSIEVPELTLEYIFKSLLKPLNGHRNPGPNDSLVGIISKLYNRYVVEAPSVIEAMVDEETEKKIYPTLSSLSSDDRLLLLCQLCEFNLMDIDNFWKVHHSQSTGVDVEFWRLDKVGQDLKGNPFYIIGNHQLYHVNLSSSKWTLLCNNRADWRYFLDVNPAQLLKGDEARLVKYLCQRFDDDIIESIKKDERIIYLLSRKLNLKIPSSFSDFGIKRSSRIQAQEIIKQQQLAEEMERIKTERLLNPHIPLRSSNNLLSSSSMSMGQPAKKQLSREERMAAREDKMFAAASAANFGFEPEEAHMMDEDVFIEDGFIEDGSSGDGNSSDSDVDDGDVDDDYSNDLCIKTSPGKLVIRLPNPQNNQNQNQSQNECFVDQTILKENDASIEDFVQSFVPTTTTVATELIAESTAVADPVTPNDFNANVDHNTDENVADF